MLQSLLQFGETYLPRISLGNPRKDPQNTLKQKTTIHARYDWTTGVPDNGNAWRKCRVVPRAYPSHPLICAYFHRVGNKERFRLPGAGGEHFHRTLDPSPGHIRCRYYYVDGGQLSCLSEWEGCFQSARPAVSPLPPSGNAEGFRNP